MPRTAIILLLGLLLSGLAYALLREASEEVLEASGEARADSLEQSSSESTEGAALVESEPEEDAVQEIHQVLCLKGRKGMPKHIDSIHIYGYGSPKLGRYRIDSLKVFTKSAHSMMRPGASLDHAYGYYGKNRNPIEFMDLDFDGYEDIATFNSLPRSVHLVPMPAYPIEASFEQEVLSPIGVRAEDAVVFSSPVSSSKVMVSNFYEGDAYKGVEIWQLEANRAEKLGAIGIYQEVAVGDRSEWEYLPVLDKVYAYESFSGNVYVFFGIMDLVLIKDKKWIRSRGPVTVDVKRWKLEGLDFDI